MSSNASIHACLGALSLCAVLVAQAATAGTPAEAVSGPVVVDAYGGVLQSTLPPEEPAAPVVPASPAPSASPAPVDEAAPGAAIYSPFFSPSRDRRSAMAVATPAADGSDATGLTLALTLSAAGVAALGCCWVVVGLRGARGSVHPK